MYERLIAYVAGQYWAIHEPKWRAMLAVLQLRAAGDRLTPEEIAANIEAHGGKADAPLERRWDITAGEWIAWDAAAPPPTGAQGRQTIAVIGVQGILGHRAGTMGEMSGGASTERLAAAVRTAANDPSVKGIVLDVNSPGGAVEGVTELANEIRAARAMKPVEAVANAHAESGGYWIASAADYLTAIPSATVGSIGVFSVHTDMSKAQEMMGVKTTVIRDTVLSKYKAEGLAEPLSEEARAHVESIANSYADMFARDIARGRGVSIDTVRKNFGQGRTLPAKAAVDAGMLDGIGSLDDAVRRVARGATPRKAAPPAGPAAEDVTPMPAEDSTAPVVAAVGVQEMHEAVERIKAL